MNKRGGQILKLFIIFFEICLSFLFSRSICAYALLFSYDDKRSLENPFILEEFQLITGILMAPLCNEKDQQNSLQILTETLTKMNELSSNHMVI
jgi:hypothetical protein